MTTHELKTWPRFYDAIESGEKTFEIRRNDRAFQTGDIVSLFRWDPALHDADCDVRCYRHMHGAEQPYRTLKRRIGFMISSALGCDLGEFVVFSLLPASTGETQ